MLGNCLHSIGTLATNSFKYSIAKDKEVQSFLSKVCVDIDNFLRNIY